ncbi:helix-turn-helix domain-containing protein [Kordia algicida OT-1]|uniref:Transcriptional regulator n=1 Tax=Kordia algicida OT-1 TaxID=391587 RepID=A9DLF7_9FLAO|nr:helix-turn-helix domain-containing protein [Kordia algicida]EDP98557.1 transcriptional regulator [Kordia algicida OT-1]
MKKLLLFLLLFFVGMIALSQQNEDLLKEYNNLYRQLRSMSSEEAETKVRAYIGKAKTTSESRFIGRGYYLLALKSGQFEDKIVFLDSVLYYTKDIKDDKKFPLYAYMTKGVTLYFNKQYPEALNNYLLAVKQAKASGNSEAEYDMKNNIAILKRVTQDYEEAEKLLLECMLYEEGKDKMYVSKYLFTLLQLSSVYYESGKTKEASAINTKGIELAQAQKDDFFKHAFTVNEGINSHIKGDFKTSIETIQKAIPHLEVDDILVAEFYLGKNYDALGEKEKAINYFKKVDTFYTKNNDIFPPLRESYVYLIKDAVAKKDERKELYYTKQLLKIDSAIHADYRYLSKNISKEYDIPTYVANKDRLIEKLEGKNRRITNERDWIVIASSIIGVIIIGFLIYYYRLKKQYEKRYNDIIEQSNATIEEEIIVKNAKPQAVSLGIDQQIIEEVLKELSRFEAGEAYLTNQISLKDVAKIVNTNSKYLSKIVNSYKGKNFTTYINDLRVDYLVSHVQTDTKYQKYTIRAIAEEIGFSNPEGFSRAFQKKTGLKPSYFIKKVRENSVKKQ